MELKIFDVISLLGISQGLLLAFILGKRHQTNHKANRWLALFLIVACIMLAARIAIIRFPSLWLFRRICMVDPIIFLYGPLTYTYVKELMQADHTPSKVWRDYGLAMLYFLFVGYLNVIPFQTFEEHWAQGVYMIPFSLIEILGLVQNIYFWILSKKFLSTYEETRKQQMSYNQSTLKFLGISHKMIGVILVFWLMGFIGNYFLGLQNAIFGYNAIWIALSLLIYLTAYFALTQPEIFKVHLHGNLDIPSKNYQRLQDHEIASLKTNLDALMDHQKIFTDNELTLSVLAHRLDTTSNNLSWLLNKVYNTNFYDFVNERRIEEFIRKVKNQEHMNHTLLALSLEVGFNSKSTFNKAFKTLKQDTPSNFIKKLSV